MAMKKKIPLKAMGMTLKNDPKPAVAKSSPNDKKAADALRPKPEKE